MSLTSKFMNPFSNRTRLAPILGSLLLVGSWSTAGGTASDRPTAVSLNDLAWIAGDWIGGDDESIIQEQWSGPQGDSMMGMFRMIQAGAVVFYEFMTIELDKGDPLLRIKHFNPGLVGWEEKDDSVIFRLEELAGQRAVFSTTKDGNPERLVFDRQEDELTITLEKPADGTQTSFRYKARQR